MSFSDLRNRNKGGSFITEEKKKKKESEMLNKWLEGDEHQGNFRFLEREDKTGSGQLGSDSVTSQHLNKRTLIQLNFDPFTLGMLKHV